MRSLSFVYLSIASLTFFNLGLPHSGGLAATNFSEQEIDDNRLVAVARPYDNGKKYDLLVIEQLPGARPCWQETGSNPVFIDPLLLNFDFTGSCERSTDSNGYSIRINGEDYGLDYLFRIVERNGELWLVGTPRGRNASVKPELVIGRTRGLKPGLLKIFLNPGWRMTQRTISGTPLHHIYFSARNTDFPTPDSENSSPKVPASPQNNTPKPVKEWKFTAPISSEKNLPPVVVRENIPEKLSSPPPLPDNAIKKPSEPLSEDIPEKLSSLPPLPDNATKKPTEPLSDGGRKSLSEILPLPSNGLASLPTTTPSSTTSPSVFRVIALAKNSQEQQKVKQIYPDAFATSYQGLSVLQVGRFGNRNNAELIVNTLKSAGLEGRIVQ